MTFLTLLLTTSTADAYSSGKTGSSTSGCGGCHGSTADSSTSVSFGVPSGIAPGETVDVTFDVTTSDSSRTAGGLNVSASDGSLAAGSNTQLSSNEITHTGREAMTSGTVTFEFTWTAPSADGTYTFYGAGNAIDQNYGSSGDGWNTTTLTVEVSADYADEDGDDYQAFEDCDDKNADVNPGAEEVCDGIDNNCDAAIDEGLTSAFYADADGDGYGDASASAEACDAPSGYVSDDTDCDDGDATIYPGAEEVEDDGIDQDCDGTDAVTDTTGGEDTGDTTGGDDTGEDDDDDDDEDGDTGEDDEKGCATVSGGGAWAVIAGLVALVGRRRRTA